MMQKTKLILSALLVITTFTCILSPNSYAQEQEEERGKKGRIKTTQELINMLLKEGKVNDYKVNGDVVIGAINKEVISKLKKQAILPAKSIIDL